MKPEHLKPKEIRELIAIAYIFGQRNRGEIVITEEEVANLPPAEDIFIKYPKQKNIFKATEFPYVYRTGELPTKMTNIDKEER